MNNKLFLNPNGGAFFGRGSNAVVLVQYFVSQRQITILVILTNMSLGSPVH